MIFDLQFFAPLLAFLAALVLVPPSLSFAKWIGLVDRPGGRKTHEGEIPLIGGLVIFSVFMIIGGFAYFEWEGSWPLLAALTVLLLVGGWDDLVQMHPWIKFFAQIAAACLIVLPGHAQIHYLGDLFGLGNFGLGFMAIPFSLAAVTLLINAMNLMDGLDGLTAGKSAVILGWLMTACVFSHRWNIFLEISVLLGALAGFLVYNMRHPFRKKASIFLGDAGSMSLGLTIAWFSISLAKEPDPVLEPISVAWILALPIMDTCAQFFRRMRAGRHPFSPDRGHFHHHFIDAGLPVGRATILILTLGLVLGGVGYGGSALGVPQIILTVSWIALLFVHMALSCKPQIYVRLFSPLRVDKKRAPDRLH